MPVFKSRYGAQALAVCALAVVPLGCTAVAEVEEVQAVEREPGPEEIAPWIVFAEESALHVEPSLESDVVREVAQGEEFFGEYYRHEPTDKEWLIVDLEEDDSGRAFLPRWHIHRIHPDNVREGDIPIGQEVVDRWWGLPLDYEPSDLVPTPIRFRLRQSESREYPLRAEASAALVEMIEAGEADGVFIRVCSAYRSGSHQTMLYTRNVGRRGPQQRSSAPPGHSEHQLGTCVDLCDEAGTAVISQRFAETPESAWLEENGARFGWRRSYYPHNTEETGYISEPWHWRYWGTEETLGN